MALTDRAAEAIGGPGGGTTWYDDGATFTLQNHASITATTTANELPVGVVPYPNKVIQPGVTYQDVLGSSNVIQAIYGGQIAAASTLAAQATLTLLVRVWRGGALLGGDGILGWKASGGGTPGLNQFTAVQMPFITANTALIPAQQGGAVAATTSGAILLVQPGDIITVLLQTSSGTVVVPVSVINLTQV